MSSNLWVIRHGETEWSRSGAHTGRTDIPLTEAGKRQALHVRDLLAGREFALVLTSPLARARDTCYLAGYRRQAEIEPLLMEWDYGDYEGRTTAEIRTSAPGWSVWSCGVPNGETIDQVAARANRLIERALEAGGDVAMFGHAHILRILAAGWLGLPASCGSLFTLGEASIGILGYERETRVIERWNVDACLNA